MPRQPRLEVDGGIHHVWQRGNNRRAIFLDVDDRETFLRLLQQAVREHEWHCLAYCLMQNHFHLVLETPVANLGVGMRYLDSRYAQLFNERHSPGGGHVFQARFGSKLVRTDEQFAQLLRYVAHNPVSAGLCTDPADWGWSSHSAALRCDAHRLLSVDRVEALLEPFRGRATSAYAALFEHDGPLAHLAPGISPWELRPSLAEILSGEDLVAAVRRAKRHGYRLADVAGHLGVSEATLWRHLKGGASVPLR